VRALFAAFGLVLVAVPLMAADPSLWQGVYGYDPYAQAEGCVVRSRPLRMADGYHGAQVRLTFGDAAVTVVTDSNIDPSYPGQGIAVDGGERVAPDTPFPFGRQSAVFKLERDTLVEAFRRGGSAELALGFWPTWPVTATQRLEISLLGFTEAHAAYLASTPEGTHARLEDIELALAQIADFGVF
jgi:hypothetical protein